MRRATTYLALCAFFAPALAFASTTTDLVSQLAGLFYIIVGLALVAAFLLMGAGTIMWVVRFGTDETYRSQAITMMEWAVATLFTLVLVLGVVEFIQSHTSTVLYLIALCIIVLVIWVVATSGLLTGGGGESGEEHEE